MNLTNRTFGKILISVAAGLCALLLCRYYIIIDSVYNLKFTWSMLFPLMISMFWGRYYAYFSYFCGGACMIPFLVYPNFGMANLLPCGLFFFVLVINDKALLATGRTAFTKNIYAVNILFGALEYLLYLGFFPKLLKLNYLLGFHRLAISIAPSILKILSINLIIANFLMIVFADLLLEFNFIRRLFRLPLLKQAGKRYRLGLTAGALIVCFVGFDALVDSSYFGVKGLHVSLFMRNTGGYSRLITVSIFFCIVVKIIMDAIVKIDELNASLESRIEARTDQLKEAYGDLESYSYTVSHELKTPLREIALYTGFVLEDNPESLPDQSAQDLRAVQKICGDTTQMIEKMMMYSKIGYTAMHREPIDMGQLVEDCLEEIRKSNTDHAIQATIHRVPQLNADRFLIKQAIFNILSNAVKFSGNHPATEIVAGCMTGEKERTYYFKDNGVGFEMKYSKKMFGLFDTVHNRSDFEGNGIGLATVKKIIERHQGKVDIYAEKGKGCVVFLIFPRELFD